MRLFFPRTESREEVKDDALLSWVAQRKCCFWVFYLCRTKCFVEVFFMQFIGGDKKNQKKTQLISFGGVGVGGGG